MLVAIALSGCPRETDRVAMPRRAPAVRPVLKRVSYSIASAQPIAFPFGGETVTPYVAADGSGGFLVSWIERKTSSLNFAALRGGRWFQSRTIARGNLLVNKADFPSIAAGPSDLILAQWVERNGHGSSVRIARSDDGGATWSPPVTPHPAIESEFGFASILAMPDGTARAVWLDGRTLEGGEEGHGEMALRSATIAKDGKLSAEAVVDPRVCDCCQTGIALASGGPLVTYRNRSRDEIRDVSVVAQTANGWLPPTTLHADGWKLLGCPVNGPRIAADGPRVAVVWFTAVKDRPRVQLALSTDGGATFASPVPIDEGHPAGHVDVGLLSDGSALVTWVEGLGATAYIDVRRVSAARVADPVVRLGSGDSSSAIGYPRLAVSHDNAVVAWNGGSSVEVAAIQLSKR